MSLFYRNHLEYLEGWFEKRDRKPLVIRGARQVGKSTIVEMLAKKKDLQLVEINLEKPHRFVSQFSSFNPRKVIDLIELELKVEIHPEKSIIFFDEAQAAPEIFALLRYFYEETPEYALITTGSLLEFSLNEPDFSFPVGRIEFLFMGPMTFEEFLGAQNEQKMLSFLKDYNFDQDWPETLHYILSEQLKNYLIVGGMPDSVRGFVDTKSLSKTAQIRNTLVSTFELDFQKYSAKADTNLLKECFKFISANVGNKVKYARIDSKKKSTEVNTALSHLCMARVTSKIFHSDCSGIPLGVGRKKEVFKMLFLDVGLISALLGINELDFINEDLILLNNGSIAEQFIGQHLQYIQAAYKEPELYYWIREKKNSSAEVDYVVNFGNRIIPIEVKAGKTGQLKSLHQFIYEKKIQQAVRFNVGPPSRLQEIRTTSYGEINFELTSLPLYMICQLPRLLKW